MGIPNHLAVGGGHWGRVVERLLCIKAHIPCANDAADHVVDYRLLILYPGAMPEGIPRGKIRDVEEIAEKRLDVYVEDSMAKQNSWDSRVTMLRL